MAPVGLLRLGRDVLAVAGVAGQGGVAVIAEHGAEAQLVPVGAQDLQAGSELARIAHPAAAHAHVELERHVERQSPRRGADEACQLAHERQRVHEQTQGVAALAARRTLGQVCRQLADGRRVAAHQVHAPRRRGDDRVDLVQVEDQPARSRQASEHVAGQRRAAEGLERRSHRPALGAREPQDHSGIAIEGSEVEQEHRVPAAARASERGERGKAHRLPAGTERHLPAPAPRRSGRRLGGRPLTRERRRRDRPGYGRADGDERSPVEAARLGVHGRESSYRSDASTTPASPGSSTARTSSPLRRSTPAQTRPKPGVGRHRPT